MARSLDGSSVLVAGATGGLGSPLCRMLQSRGARLTLFSRDAHALEILSETLGGPEAGVAMVSGDITDPVSCRDAVEVARSTHGGLDGVVNAAGVVAFGPLADTDDEVLRRLVDVNLLGPLRLVKAALPALSENGFVCNLSAVVAEQPTAGMVAYSAAKAGLSAADTALTRELRREKVSVIDVRPPHTETGLAGRPIAGSAPKLPQGLDPETVAARVVAAIESDEREVPSTAFG